MRGIKWIIVSLGLILIIFYYIGGYIAKELLNYGLDIVKPELENQGITITQFDYGKVSLHSFKSFMINDVNIKFNLDRQIYGKKSFSANFFSQSAIIRIININDSTLGLTLKNFNLFIASNEENPDRPFGKFENAYWKGEAPIRLYNLKESGELILDRLKTLLKENSIPDPIEFSGDALLNLDGQTIKIRMFTEQIDNRTYIYLDQEDLMHAATRFEDIDLSEKEAELISKFPARALHILKITRDARRISENEKSRDPDFPADALKHIYWSYHLTRIFGPEFTKEITDAHETLPNNTLQQRKMDYHNNEIGRKLATRDLSVEELKRIVLKSPEVIRFPDQIQ
jgi:hypothetical protein